MGKKFSKKAQPSTKDEDSLVGNGKSNEKLKAHVDFVENERGSGPIDEEVTQNIPVITQKLDVSSDPQPHEPICIPSTHIQQENTLCVSRSKACFISTNKMVNTYPGDADTDIHVVAPLRGTCTKSLMPFPKQKGNESITYTCNIMILAAYGVDLDKNQQNEILLQDRPIVQYFVENVEPDVPFELVTIEHQ